MTVEGRDPAELEKLRVIRAAIMAHGHGVAVGPALEALAALAALVEQRQRDLDDAAASAISYMQQCQTAEERAERQQAALEAAREWVRVHDADRKTDAEWANAMQRLRVALAGIQSPAEVPRQDPGGREEARSHAACAAAAEQPGSAEGDESATDELRDALADVVQIARGVASKAGAQALRDAWRRLEELLRER